LSVVRRRAFGRKFDGDNRRVRRDAAIFAICAVAPVSGGMPLVVVP